MKHPRELLHIGELPLWWSKWSKGAGVQVIDSRTLRHITRALAPRNRMWMSLGVNCKQNKNGPVMEPSREDLSVWKLIGSWCWLWISWRVQIWELHVSLGVVAKQMYRYSILECRCQVPKRSNDNVFKFADKNCTNLLPHVDVRGSQYGCYALPFFRDFNRAELTQCRANGSWMILCADESRKPRYIIHYTGLTVLDFGVGVFISSNRYDLNKTDGCFIFREAEEVTVEKHDGKMNVRI